MSLTAHHITYIHPDNETLFRQIDLILPQGQKAALIGNNGCGKSTLLKILAGEITPQKGEIAATTHPYYVPQHFGQYNRLTISDALGISRKLEALYQITAGNTAAKWFDRLGDDWLIEQRSRTALTAWGLGNLPLSAPLSRLSGGEKTKVFLAGMQIHSPTIILMDEPTKLTDIHAEKIENTSEEVARLRGLLADRQHMQLNFEASGKPKGKRIVSARQLTFSYSGGTPLWKQPLDFQLLSGERVAIQGNNGTGKTTLLKLIAGYLEPTAGCLERNE